MDKLYNIQQLKKKVFWTADKILYTGYQQSN